MCLLSGRNKTNALINNANNIPKTWLWVPDFSWCNSLLEIPPLSAVESDQLPTAVLENIHGLCVCAGGKWTDFMDITSFASCLVWMHFL